MTPEASVKETAAVLPLTGVRVLDFSWVHAGPLACMTLAELGAEVIKIETNKRWDLTRRLPPMADRVNGMNRSGYYNSVNRGKRSATLDLSTPEAIAMVKDLVRSADVVLENFSAGVMERLGLGYDVLKAVRPDVIMVSISGYGATGPDKHYVAYGPPLSAFSGHVMVNGYPDGEPQAAGAAWPDPMAGFTAAFCVLTALHHRAETGEGQWIDISQAESMIALLGDQIMETTLNGRQPARQGNGDDGFAPHDCFPCAGDDRWVAIAVTDEVGWRGLVEAFDYPALNDPRFADADRRWEHRDELNAIVAAWTRERTPEDAAALLQSHGVPAAPTFNAADLLANPHLAERELLQIDDHPEIGPRIMAAMPWRLSGISRRLATAAPRLGDGNDYVFGEVLGLNVERIGDLVERKVIY